MLHDNGDGSYSLKEDGSTDGYWKSLIDFKMYDNDGVGSPQLPVRPDFNMEESVKMLNEYKGGHERFPVAQDIVDEFVEKYKAEHPGQKFSDRNGNPENITPEDIDTLRKIGRKSINEFTGKDIRATEKWARKFYRELGTKSPFFRAWFGDWREYDTNRIKYVELNDQPITSSGISHEPAVNSETKWKIFVNGNGIAETANKNNKWSLAYHSLSNIQQMLESAILLDSVSVTNPSSKMDKMATFIHHMYCPVKLDGLVGVAKLYVTENIGDEHKFYLTKIEMESVDSKSQSKNSDLNSSTDSDISIAEIFDFVKRNDKNFEKDSKEPVYFTPNPVNPLLLNEDGTPKVFYHQTKSEFTVFENGRAEAGNNDSETPDGYFFKTNDHDIGLEGKKQMPVYLSAYKLLQFKDRQDANAWYCKNIPGYSELQEKMNFEIDPMVSQLEDIENDMFIPDDISDEEYDRLDAKWNSIHEKLGIIEKDYRGKLRSILNRYFLKGKSDYQGIELAYDGHRYVNGKRENVHTVIVFERSQIKSAIDNIGTFNREDPDIRYSDRETLSPAEIVRNIFNEDPALSGYEKYAQALKSYQTKTGLLEQAKRRREKLQAHLNELRATKNDSVVVNGVKKKRASEIANTAEHLRKINDTIRDYESQLLSLETKQLKKVIGQERERLEKEVRTTTNKSASYLERLNKSKEKAAREEYIFFIAFLFLLFVN